MNRYEAMFLVDNATATNDWDNLIIHIRDILTKHGSEIIEIQKFGERKLAYKIGDHSRGTYILIRFNAPGLSVSKIRKEYRLSDKVIRTLIVRDDKQKRQPTAAAIMAAGDELQSKPLDSLPVEIEDHGEPALVNRNNNEEESFEESDKES